MVQGDGSVYPILPISLSIVTFIYIISLIISILCDYLYDLYLVRFADPVQKVFIEKRVKSDLTRIKNFLKGDKIEKFDNEAAKNRLTIINKLLMEKINSKENRPFLDAVKEKQQQQQQQKGKEIKKDDVEKAKEVDDTKKPDASTVKIIKTNEMPVPNKAPVLSKELTNLNKNAQETKPKPNGVANGTAKTEPSKPNNVTTNKMNPTTGSTRPASVKVTRPLSSKSIRQSTTNK